MYCAAPQRRSRCTASRRDWPTAPQTRRPVEELRGERMLGHWIRSTMGRPPRWGPLDAASTAAGHIKRKSSHAIGCPTYVQNEAVGPRGSLSLVEALSQPVHHRSVWDCKALLPSLSWPTEARIESVRTESIIVEFSPPWKSLRPSRCPSSMNKSPY